MPINISKFGFLQSCQLDQQRATVLEIIEELGKKSIEGTPAEKMEWIRLQLLSIPSFFSKGEVDAIRDWKVIEDKDLSFTGWISGKYGGIYSSLSQEEKQRLSYQYHLERFTKMVRGLFDVRLQEEAEKNSAPSTPEARELSKLMNVSPSEKISQQHLSELSKKILGLYHVTNSGTVPLKAFVLFDSIVNFIGSSDIALNIKTIETLVQVGFYCGSVGIFDFLTKKPTQDVNSALDSLNELIERCNSPEAKNRGIVSDDISYLLAEIIHSCQGDSNCDNLIRLSQWFKDNLFAYGSGVFVSSRVDVYEDEKEKTVRKEKGFMRFPGVEMLRNMRSSSTLSREFMQYVKSLGSSENGYSLFLSWDNLKKLKFGDTAFISLAKLVNNDAGECAVLSANLSEYSSRFGSPKGKDLNALFNVILDVVGQFELKRQQLASTLVVQAGSVESQPMSPQWSALLQQRNFILQVAWCSAKIEMVKQGVFDGENKVRSDFVQKLIDGKITPKQYANYLDGKWWHWWDNRKIDRVVKQPVASPGSVSLPEVRVPERSQMSRDPSFGQRQADPVGATTPGIGLISDAFRNDLHKVPQPKKPARVPEGNVPKAAPKGTEVVGGQPVAGNESIEVRH